MYSERNSNIFLIVLWAIIGGMNLLSGKPISHFQYGMIWFLFISDLICKAITNNKKK